MKIQQNVSLKEYTTFKVGGCAKYFAVIESIEDLKQAVDFVKQNQLPVFVLGGGSNLLVSDEGVDGIVLKMEMKGIKEVSPPYGGETSVIASAGEIWDDLVKQTVEEGLYGLENLSYIPGTVGASAVQNIGAYGVEVKDIIDWVETFNIETGEIEKLKNSECCFGYRDSIFKKEEGKNLIVVRVAYNLQKDGELKTDYKDIQKYLKKDDFWIATSQAPRKEDSEAVANDEDQSSSSSLRAERTSNRRFGAIYPETSKQLREIIIQIRKNKLPDLKKVGTAGSFFKNPVIAREQLDELLKKYSELPYYKSEVPGTQFYKIPIAYILDKVLKLKGFRNGEVEIYKKHSLIIVNTGDATCEDIKNFYKEINKMVEDKSGLCINNEVVEW